MPNEFSVPKLLAVNVLFLIGACCDAPQGRAATQPAAVSFAATGKPHTNRFSEHTATLLPDGTVLVTGGWDGSRRGPSRLKAAAEIFDPATGEWTAVPNMSRTRSGHTAILLKSGKVLVVGQQDAELFDAATRKWSSAGNLTQPRSRHTATLLDNAQVAIVGGFIVDGKVTATIERYDPHSGKWHDGGQLLEPRAYHTAFALPGNRLLLAGGENPRNTPTAEIYDATTGRSMPAAPLQKPHAFCQASVALNDGRLLITGGEGTDLVWPPKKGVPPEHLSLAELYDPAANRWTRAKPMTAIRCGHTATLLGDGRVLVLGGEGKAAGTSELFDPASGEWSAGPKLPQARRGHTATLLADGRILIVGGSTSDFVPIVATPAGR